jgi:leader peptidase (prepilin peptidase)/N-methyltransferase
MLVFSLLFVFLIGAAVGSFLNVAVARLPLEKSLLWPNSRCGACLQPIQWYDNIPLISYLWLKGKCRSCGQGYSIVYLLVELGTALGFVGLFWLEVVQNVHDWPGANPFAMRQGIFPWSWWVGFSWHAVLFSFLLVASVCDMKSREIPLSLTLFGTMVGLIGSSFLPWPWPYTPDNVLPPLQAFDVAWQRSDIPLAQGIYPWPFWGPLPAWFAPGGNWQTGLMTGICGALVGTFMLRGIGFLFSAGLGKEALGLGDADLMMLAGSFLGWQIVVVAFFLSVIPALFIGIIILVVRRDNSLPFGPSLSLSVMATCLAWKPICEGLRPIFFWGQALFWLTVLSALCLLFMSFVLRVLRGGAS